MAFFIFMNDFSECLKGSQSAQKEHEEYKYSVYKLHSILLPKAFTRGILFGLSNRYYLPRVKFARSLVPRDDISEWDSILKISLRKNYNPNNTVIPTQEGSYLGYPIAM